MHLGLDDSAAAGGVCLPQQRVLPTLVTLRNGCTLTGNMAQQQGGAVAVQSGALMAEVKSWFCATCCQRHASMRTSVVLRTNLFFPMVFAQVREGESRLSTDVSACIPLLRAHRSAANRLW